MSVATRRWRWEIAAGQNLMITLDQLSAIANTIYLGNQSGQEGAWRSMHDTTCLLLAEGHLSRPWFAAMLGQIALLPLPTGQRAGGRVRSCLPRLGEGEVLRK